MEWKMENAIESLFKIDVTWTLITVIFSLIIYLYLKMREKYKYWERKGVAYLKPLPIFGSLLPVCRGRLKHGDLYRNAYKQFPNEKVVGHYEFLKPVLILRDLNLIEKVLVKDFKHFTDHQFAKRESSSLLEDGLFNMGGDKWRAVRNKIIPIFTIGKLKLMMNEMLNCSEDMIKEFQNNVNTDYEIKDAVSTYVTDIMTRLILGFHMTDNKTRKEFMSKTTSFFLSTEFFSLKTTLIEAFPKLSKFCGLRFVNNELNNYFLEILKSTFKQRTDGIYRNDLVQLLLNLKDKGSIELPSKNNDDAHLNMDKKSPIEDNVEITEELIFGQASQFLLGGLTTLEYPIHYTLLELALNPEIQERARLEIKTILGKHGNYTYEAIKEMTYLEQCIHESFRTKSTSYIFRECTKQYTTDDGLVIEKGTKVIIPSGGIHIDPNYYQDPEKFIPERNLPNNLKSKFAFLPFGIGPRMCIADRFAMLMMKIGLAKIIENFKMAVSPKNQYPIKISKSGFTIVQVSKIYLNLTPA